MLKRYRRIVAIFFVSILLSNVLAPSISYALTSGPTAPEATSFEPVDTTSMVNLFSGDLAYNIPLLEVPGPAGGYPLSLSYHAGIQPNEDASWVGLGWTLNPGAITRNVNGIADDVTAGENSTRYFWSGGTRETYSFGVSIGIAGTPAAVSGGESYSMDTYQGLGIGGSLGVGTSFSQDSPLLFNVGINKDPYRKGLYGSGGISLSARVGEIGKGGQVLGSLGASVTSNGDVGFSGGVTLRDGGLQSNLLGINISGSGKGAYGALGGSNFYMNNRNASRMSISNSIIPIMIPMGAASLTLSYNFMRYWIDEMDFTKVNGALHFPQQQVDEEHLLQNSYDIYSLLDPHEDESISEYANGSKQLGGTFPDFDHYFVHAQGLGGQMRPYYFQQYLIDNHDYQIEDNAQGEKYRDYQVKHDQIGFTTSKAEFRFVGDFSNRFEYSPGNIQHTGTGNSLDDRISFLFGDSGPPVIGEEGNMPYVDNRLPGTRHTETLTNQEILDQVRSREVGLIETVATGFSRMEQDPNAIGAFVITNESGVKYHFALPVMTGDEYSYSENIEQSEVGMHYNEFNNPNKHAYTWYLTAVTGPDYVDRGPSGTEGDGLLNEYDWGYWVEFEYGKWTSHYAWRNPGRGFNSDLDRGFKSFHEGRKELYYLDAIRTKTHTALFVKDIRHDAKSSLHLLKSPHYVSFDIEGSWTIGADIEFSTDERDVTSALVRSGTTGYTPVQTDCECAKTYFYNDGIFGLPQAVSDAGTLNYTASPTSTLKLSKIVLISNEKIPNISKSSGEAYKQSYSYEWSIGANNMPSNKPNCDWSTQVFNHHLYQNVFDIHDLEASSGLIENSLKVIEFDTDYSLTPETENSFQFTYQEGQEPSTNEADYPLLGKLTLKSLKFLGRGGQNYIPPTQFRYDYADPLSGTGVLRHDLDGSPYLKITGDGPHRGDILKLIELPNKHYYGVVTKVVVDQYYLTFVSKEIPPVDHFLNWKTTKNPSYDKDRFDSWGLYKSDFAGIPDGGSEDVARTTTSLSAQNVDVWSLRSVRSPLGGEVAISYESDTYSEVVLTDSKSLRIADIKPTNDGSGDYLIELADPIPELDQIVSGADELGFTLLFGEPRRSIDGGNSTYSYTADFKTGTITGFTVIHNNDRWYIRAPLNPNYFVERLGRFVPPIIIYEPPVFIAGNLSLRKSYLHYGGGIRVSSIDLRTPFGTNRATYSYSNFDSNASDASSGVISYEPHGFENSIFRFEEAKDLYPLYFAADSLEHSIKTTFKRMANEDIYSLLAIAREVPSPAVGYEYVKVSSEVFKNGEWTSIPKYTGYQFEVFNKGMVGFVYDNETSTNVGNVPIENLTFKKIRTRGVKIKNYSNRIGSLKSITQVDHESGNDVFISKTQFHFLHDNLKASAIQDNDPAIDDALEVNIDLYEQLLSDRFKNQGVIQETYVDGRYARQTNDDVHLLGITSTMEEYPVISTGQTVTDFKTGITTSSENLAFDFYSGQVVQIKNADGNGNQYITEITPAYRKYPGMGLIGWGGKNMLTQVTGEKIYQIDNIGTPVGLVGASTETWSNNVIIINTEDNFTDYQAQLLPKDSEGFNILSLSASSSQDLFVEGDQLIISSNGQRTNIGVQSKIDALSYKVKVYGLFDPSASSSVPVSARLSPAYRKQASFSFVGTGTEVLTAGGLLPYATFTEFDYGSNSQGPGWQKNGEITLYDLNSHALEAIDLNGLCSSTKMSSDYSRVFATAINACYGDLAFSGAEDLSLNGSYGGSVHRGDGVEVFKTDPLDVTTTHTGTKALQLSSLGEKAFKFTYYGREEDYKASVWVNAIQGRLGYRVNGGTPVYSNAQTLKQAGEWYQATLSIPAQSSGSEIEVWVETAGGPCHFDDFRVHPISASMSSYVYNKWGELSYILDDQNLFTHYEYDSLGRLKKTFMESFNHGIVFLGENTYHYSNE